MLYLMNVDWGWIVQRPHFLALELMKYYDIKVVYPKQYIKRWKSQKKVKLPENSAHGVFLPFQDRIEIFQKILWISMRRAIGDLKDYDIIIISNPLFYKYIKDFKGTIVYDCMDNYEALERNDKIKKEIIIYEKKILERAEVVLVSSLRLKQIVEDRIGKNKAKLVRNGHNDSVCYPIKETKKKEQYSIGYIGTISSWMNFNLLDKCLEIQSNIVFHLIGPASGYVNRSSKRILFEGMIEHEQLYEVIKSYDCLIMPFILNDIILAVDPVKLYEYISYGKCIISVFYPEVARFDNFVYFYETEEECYTLIKTLSETGFPPKYNEEQQVDFLQKNSWMVRAKEIQEVISEEKNEK